LNNLVLINSHQVSIKEFNNQRVVTFKDIDRVHERPGGTARRNFSQNKQRFINGVDYFVFEGEEGRKALIQANYTNFVELNQSPNFVFYFITESGYLMLVKSLTDDLAWQVQRELINNYFRGKKLIGGLNELSPQLQVLINMELKQKQLEQDIASTKQKTQTLEHRMNNLDATNIDGTPRQRLNDMVRKYAYDNGLLYPQAWKDFRKGFNTAYRTNIEQKKNNYLKKHNVKQLSYPEYLERVGLIEDALRVADKMLNQNKGGQAAWQA
jgi:hypothetical protein